MNGFGLLPSCVEYSVCLSKINEGIAIKAEVSSKDESLSFGVVEGLVQSDEIVLLVVINHNNTFIIRGSN